uniref:FRIGIDA-like protein n=1 Tax=Caenorhabditis tropicalis TaxID=1561998 RepID=A0A1I7V0W1_9PELO
MICRVRVALKHSNPIYEEEKSSLMPSLLGAPNILRYRLLILAICFLFFYIWNRREHSFSVELRDAHAKIEVLQTEHVSVLEKLRVIWEHKNKIESELRSKKAELDKHQSKIKLKESDVYGYKKKNEQCERKLQSCRKGAEPTGVEEKIKELEGKLKETEANGGAVADILKEELKQCETKIRQLTGLF